MPAFAVEPATKALLQQAGAHGISLDLACSDWTRHYRPPNIFREGKEERGTVDLERMRPVDLTALCRVTRFSDDELEQFGPVGRERIAQAAAIYGFEEEEAKTARPKGVRLHA